MRFVLTILLFISLQANATTWYFSTTGLDGASGTTTGTAWQTPGKFITLLSTANTGDFILFKRGDVFPVGFTMTSGNSGVSIGAYGTGADPVVTGFSSLITWTNVGTNLWEASCNSGNNLDLVTVNGVTVPAGRSPNYGSYWNVDSKTDGNPATITSSSTNAASQSWIGAQIVVRHNEYNLHRDWITGHSGTTITYPTTANPNPIDGSNHKFFIQKHPATLDQQNEWYYNPSTKVLRMYSTTNPSGLNVKAATTDFFYSVQYRNRMTFTGIKFTGFDSCAIYTRFAVHFTVTNNTFEDIGSNAIDYDGDSASNTNFNTFNRIANTAFCTRFAAKVWVQGNNIDSCGLIYGMSLSNNQQRDGIKVEVYDNRPFGGLLGDSVTIIDNYITNVGYCGIRFTGRDARVIHNTIIGYGKVDSDGGGIYCNGDYDLANRRIISDNVVIDGYGAHDMGSSPGYYGIVGIYLDDNTGNTNILRNTIKNATRSGIFLHNTKDITIKGNTVYAGNGEFAFSTGDDGLGIKITGTIVDSNYFYSTASTPIIQLSSVLNDYIDQGTFTRNYYIRSSSTTPFQNFGSGGADYSFASWKSTFGWDGSSVFNVVPDDSVRIEINGTASSVPVSLTDTYIDLKGKAYAGTVSIPAYGSYMWIKKTMGQITISGKRKFIKTSN